MLSLSSLRRELEGTSQVTEKFTKDGEFVISAGTFAGIASNFDCEKEASDLASAIGKDTTLFKVISRSEESNVPVVVTAMAYSDFSNHRLELRTANLETLEGLEVSAYRIGPGGYVVVKAGKTDVQIPIVVSEELRDALIMIREDGKETPVFEETKGDFKFSIPSPYRQKDIIPVLKSVPQRDLPPYADEVPMKVDLEVVDLLDPSRNYNSPRLRVAYENDGRLIFIEGLIATQPIVRALTGVYEGEVQLDSDVIGKKFQILEVQDRRRRNGDLVKNPDGKVQKTVLVANTSRKREFAL